MTNVIINDTHLTDIANAIRTKKGTVNKIFPKDMATEISGISTGTDTSDATAMASDIVSGKTAYANGQKITGSLPNNATFTSGKGRISIRTGPDYRASIEFYNMRNNACYLPADAEIIINDDSNLTEYLGDATPDNVLENVTFTSANGGSQKGTIPNKSNSGTVFISNANVITRIPRGYYDGNVKVDIDSQSYMNLRADNIREGVTILGVTGTMKPGSSGGGSSGGTGGSSSFSPSSKYNGYNFDAYLDYPTLSVSVHGYNQIKFSWNSVVGAEKYELQVMGIGYIDTVSTEIIVNSNELPLGSGNYAGMVRVIKANKRGSFSPQQTLTW